MYQPRLCNGRGSILSRIIRRNTLRQAHGLLLLNVAIEYAHQLSVAGQREYRVACDEHADEREAIRRQVLAEYQAKYGSHIACHRLDRNSPFSRRH
jgi:hypothetical protein